MTSAPQPPSTKRTVGALLFPEFELLDIFGPLEMLGVLGDLGARILKVEEPERGDETRYWGPPFVRDTAAYFLSMNRNKESVALDLKSADDLELTRQFGRRTDAMRLEIPPKRMAGSIVISLNTVQLPITLME